MVWVGFSSLCFKSLYVYITDFINVDYKSKYVPVSVKHVLIIQYLLGLLVIDILNKPLKEISKCRQVTNFLADVTSLNIEWPVVSVGKNDSIFYVVIKKKVQQLKTHKRSIESVFSEISCFCIWIYFLQPKLTTKNKKPVKHS